MPSLVPSHLTGRQVRICVLLAMFLTAAYAMFQSGLQQPRPTLVPVASPNREPVRPITDSVELNRRKVTLGRELFHEPMLSGDRTVSCASCHDLKKGGADGRLRSIGVHGRVGKINAPTVFNSGANFRQFWDGRAATLEEQANDPILDPDEMGSNWPEVVSRLKAAPAYAQAFRSVYRDGVQPANVLDAIAEFERSLITPNSRFDRFLRGETDALNDREMEGYRKFKLYGCASCHQGVNLGGNLFQPLGTMGDYFADRGNITAADYGRYNVTGRESDRFTFKVPTLRNIARTAPYLHDGSAETLAAAVRVMARYQLGRSLSAEDVALIVEFLQTLTGEYEGRPL